MFLTALSLAGMMLAAEPLELIQTEGELVLSDSASFFTFKADGTFQSGPNGMSGRTLTGRWKTTQAQPWVVEVIATQGWMNGLSARGDYRKLVFAVYAGTTKPFTPSMGMAPIKRVFEGYWVIQELSKTTAPKK